LGDTSIEVYLSGIGALMVSPYITKIQPTLYYTLAFIAKVDSSKTILGRKEDYQQLDD